MENGSRNDMTDIELYAKILTKQKVTNESLGNCLSG